AGAAAPALGPARAGALRLPLPRRRPARPAGPAAVRVLMLPAVANLGVAYPGSSRPAVAGVPFALERGESLGVVGASGSGKTQTALALLGLPPREARVSGS